MVPQFVLHRLLFKCTVEYSSRISAIRWILPDSILFRIFRAHWTKASSTFSPVRALVSKNISSDAQKHTHSVAAFIFKLLELKLNYTTNSPAIPLCDIQPPCTNCKKYRYIFSLSAKRCTLILRLPLVAKIQNALRKRHSLDVLCHQLNPFTQTTNQGLPQ